MNKEIIYCCQIYCGNVEMTSSLQLELGWGMMTRMKVAVSKFPEVFQT